MGENYYWNRLERFEWLTDKSIDTIIGSLPPITGDVLELCCGSGMFTKRIPRTYDSYTCVDSSGSLLTTLKSDMPHVKIIPGDAESVQFPHQFDTILIFAGLHHLNTQKAIANVYKLLKKGGTFICVEPNARCWYRKHMLKLNWLLKLYTDNAKFLNPVDVMNAMNNKFKAIVLKYTTPHYKPEHLNIFGKVLARFMYWADSLSDRPSWKSFFIIVGKK